MTLARESTGKLLAVAASGQNIDRLVSCFRAAKRSGRLLVIDPYQAYVLMKLSPLSKNIPQFTWDGVRVCFAPHQVERMKDAGLMELVYEMSSKGKVTTDELAQQPGRYLMCTRSGFGMTKVFDKVGAANVELVWSMWSGYWHRDKCAMREWADRSGVTVRFIHSGGHAWPRDLARLVESIDAGQVVWVHTDSTSPETEAQS